MSTALLTLGSATALGLLLLLGATRELYRKLLDLRRYGRLVDQPRPVVVNTHLAISELEIPVAGDSELLDRAMILIVSDRCLTCYEVLGRVRSLAPERLIVLVNARSPEDAEGWLTSLGLTPGDRIVYDAFGLMAAQLGVTISPAVVRVEGGFGVGASTIPSARQFDKALDWLRRPAGRPTGPPVRTEQGRL